MKINITATSKEEFEKIQSHLKTLPKFILNLGGDARLIMDFTVFKCNPQNGTSFTVDLYSEMKQLSQTKAELFIANDVVSVYIPIKDVEKIEYNLLQPYFGKKVNM